MRLLSLLIALFCALPVFAQSQTAICRDGTKDAVTDRAKACKGHKGVVSWVNTGPGASAYSSEPQDAEPPRLDRWHGLILDETTPEEALEKFKSPKEDKTGQAFRPIKYNEWFDVKSIKSFRIIHYENIFAFNDVKLYFLNEKLVAIHLEPNGLPARVVPKAYGVEFETIFNGFTKATNPRDFDRANGKTYARYYPAVFYLMHKAPKSYVFILVGNATGSVLSKLGGSEDDSNSIPGKVEMMQMISRSLETRANDFYLK